MAAACDVLRSAREELADLRLESGGRLGARDAEARAGAAGAASRESSATCVRVVVPRTRETLGVPELDTGALDDDTLFAIGRRVGAGGARSVVVVETPGPLWSDVAAQLAEPSTARLRRATVRQLGLNGRVLESSSLAAPAWTGCRRERGAPRRHGQVWATTLVRGRRWRSVPGRHAASRRPYDLVVVLLGPHYASVGMGWWDRVASVLHRHAALVSVNAWISTLGGGFFLCQDTESARALALAQLLVVERFQDPGLARRVQLHLVYVDAQEGQLDAARARLAHLVAECPADEDTAFLWMAEAAALHLDRSEQLAEVVDLDADAADRTHDEFHRFRRAKPGRRRSPGIHIVARAVAHRTVASEREGAES